jgi:hypothetical protein
MMTAHPCTIFQVLRKPGFLVHYSSNIHYIHYYFRRTWFSGACQDPAKTKSRAGWNRHASHILRVFRGPLPPASARPPQLPDLGRAVRLAELRVSKGRIIPQSNALPNWKIPKLASRLRYAILFPFSQKGRSACNSTVSSPKSRTTTPAIRLGMNPKRTRSLARSGSFLLFYSGIRSLNPMCSG